MEERALVSSRLLRSSSSLGEPRYPCISFPFSFFLLLFPSPARLLPPAVTLTRATPNPPLSERREGEGEGLKGERGRTLSATPIPKCQPQFPPPQPLRESYDDETGTVRIARSSRTGRYYFGGVHRQRRGRCSRVRYLETDSTPPAWAAPARPGPVRAPARAKSKTDSTAVRRGMGGR